jgi:hypothetical protein
MDLDMSNLLIPLLAGDPAVMLKPAKQILKIYGKDPEDWLPDAWLQPQPQPAVAQPGEEEMGQPGESVLPPSNALPVESEKPIPDIQRATDTQDGSVVKTNETEPGAGNSSIIDKAMRILRLK